MEEVNRQFRPLEASVQSFAHVTPGLTPRTIESNLQLALHVAGSLCVI